MEPNVVDVSKQPTRKQDEACPHYSDGASLFYESLSETEKARLVSNCGVVDPNANVDITALIAEYEVYSDSEDDATDDKDIQLGVQFVAPTIGGFAIENI